jgi:O-antigen ligase
MRVDVKSYLDRLRAAPIVVVLAVMTLAPLPYGSAEYGWVCIWLVLLSVCALARIWTEPPPSRATPLVILTALGGALTLFVAVQVAAWVPGAVKDGAWAVAAERGIDGAGGRIAAETSTPIYSLAMPLSFLVALLAGYLCIDRHSRCITLTKSLVISGFVYALLGFAIGISNPGYVLFEKKIAYQSDFTGPFVNRNTAATYFGICLLAAIMLAFRAWRDNWPRGYLPRREKFLFLIGSFSSTSSFWAIAAATLLVAVLLTGSRAGAFLSVAFASVLFLLLVRKLGELRRSTIIGGMAVVLTLIVVIFGSGNVLTRMTEGFGENGRYAAWASTWHIVRDFPFLGTGLGTFMTSFPAYREDSRGIMQVWERAHNTPLEFAAELGGPAALVVCLIWLAAIALLWRTYRKESDSYALPALAIAVMLLTGVHSLVDFPLQIPGCAIPAGILLGGMMRQSWS